MAETTAEEQLEAASRFVREAEAENSRYLERRARDREPGASSRRVFAALTETSCHEAAQDAGAEPEAGQ